MYGYTPPAVIAVDADLLSDCGGFQRIAAAIVAQLHMRPVWVVVGAPASLDDAESRVSTVESFYRDPRDAPSHVTDPTRAVADALAHHVSELGAHLPVRVQLPLDHTPASAVVPGTWYDASDISRVTGAPFVVAWAADPAVVPSTVRGVPFRREEPRMGGALA